MCHTNLKKDDLPIIDKEYLDCVLETFERLVCKCDRPIDMDHDVLHSKLEEFENIHEDLEKFYGRVKPEYRDFFLISRKMPIVIVFIQLRRLDETMEILKQTISREHTSNNQTSNKHTSNKHALNKHTSNKHTSNKHTSNKHTSNKHTSNNHTSNKHTSNKHALNNHTSNNHTSNNHTSNKHTRNNQTFNKYASNKHTSNKHTSNKHARNKHTSNKYASNKHTSNKHARNNHTFNNHTSSKHTFSHTYFSLLSLSLSLSLSPSSPSLSETLSLSLSLKNSLSQTLSPFCSHTRVCDSAQHTHSLSLSLTPLTHTHTNAPETRNGSAVKSPVFEIAWLQIGTMAEAAETAPVKLKTSYDPCFTPHPPGNALGLTLALMHLMCFSYKVAARAEALCTGGNLQVTEDGTSIFAICATEVNQIDTQTGRKLQSIDGDSSAVTCIALAPDGDAHQAPVLAMSFDKTSTLLATGSADATIKVWDVRQGFCTHNFKGSQGIVSWDLNESKARKVFKGHMSVVTAIQFDSTGKQLVTASRDRVMMTWDVATGQNLDTVPTFEVIEDMALVPAQNFGSDLAAVTVGEQGRLRIWDLKSGKELAAQALLPREVPSHMRQILLYNEHETAVVLTHDQQLQIFDMQTQQRTRTIMGHYDDVLDASFVQGSDNVAVVATNCPTLYAVDFATMNATPLHGHDDVVLTLAVSADGRFIASGSKDNTVRIWYPNEDTGVFEPVGVGKGHAHAVGAVAFSCKRNAFVVSTGTDTTLKRWKLDPIAQRAEGEVVELKADYTVRAHEKDVNAICVAPNDKLVATASQDKLIKLWDAATGAERQTLRGHKRGVWSIAFSPVDQLLASASGDTTVRVWALATGTCLRTLEGHSNSVLNVRFVTRGQQLISSGSDGLLQLWNLKTADCAGTFDAHEDKIWALSAADREGNAIVSGASDGTLVLWRDDTLEKEDDAKAQTEEEMQLSQELDNLMAADEHAEAFKLALRLERPRTILKLTRNLVEREQEDALRTIIADLGTEQLQLLLGFMKDWNVNSRSALLAQTLLHHVLATHDVAKLAQTPALGRTVNALIAYTERHFQRLQKLAQQSHVLDFVWRSIRSLDTDESEKRPALASDAEVAAKRPHLGGANSKRLS
ncbi:uncharacterized protein MONBRDRAFT_33929 [Monosiga brevicollis MX1]|uniref:U3 small nucleolar RNA-associated protein 13 C-terminal domain-containing protein n=1 Tax=Monosiga brevicollis TaxID=81824 RepID=A9V8K5_MONBE|nr:uncharacterized protein MONBRDRAFT_33929 [Monosiga brevicollis MX1]EDQ86160.1 predicted protein [Monosiga brevicollis MX1]|eukprot:XP_001749085.1 hypothetical protein [Monosiga brevicollis MX1]